MTERKYRDVKGRWLKTSGGGGAVLAILHCLPTLCAREAPATNQIINPFEAADFTLPSLEANKQKQLQAAQTWKVFHDFQFSDHYEQSGITFEHHPVDDGTRNYKA